MPSIFRAIVVISLSLFAWPQTSARAAAPMPLRRTPEIVYEIPYANWSAGDLKVDRRQSLDLYLPATGISRPPLFIFVHGGFWTLSDDEYRIGPALAEALVPKGVAVALVRYRLAPDQKHPSQAQDVAASVAYLEGKADQYGYDANKIFLGGHSAGAHLAALVGLGPVYLRAHRVSPRSLAGIVALSGIHDLNPRRDTSEQQKRAVEQAFGSDPAVLKAASPISHVRPEAPHFSS
jgi:arylformamidase